MAEEYVYVCVDVYMYMLSDNLMSGEGSSKKICIDIYIYIHTYTYIYSYMYIIDMFSVSRRFRVSVCMWVCLYCEMTLGNCTSMLVETMRMIVRSESHAELKQLFVFPLLHFWCATAAGATSVPKRWCALTRSLCWEHLSISSQACSLGAICMGLHASIRNYRTGNAASSICVKIRTTS